MARLDFWGWDLRRAGGWLCAGSFVRARQQT